MTRTSMLLAAACLSLMRFDLLWAQAPSPIRVLFDQAHGELPPPAQMDAIARKLGLEIRPSVEPITDATLAGTRILYLRAPSEEFTPSEIEAIVSFVKRGGSLLLVMDEERRLPL
jgi:hypothetical protein